MVFFQNSSYKKVKKALELHGFVIGQGGNHAKGFCNEHQVTIIFPRGKRISSGVMKGIVNLLVNKCGIDETELVKKLK